MMCYIIDKPSHRKRLPITRTMIVTITVSLGYCCVMCAKTPQNITACVDCVYVCIGTRALYMEHCSVRRLLFVSRQHCWLFPFETHTEEGNYTYMNVSSQQAVDSFLFVKGSSFFEWKLPISCTLHGTGNLLAAASRTRAILPTHRPEQL